MVSVRAGSGSGSGAKHIAQRYRILEHLGRGGMATVFRVLDERNGHEVALKQMAPAPADIDPSDFIDMFSREYRLLLELSHPAIVKVLDYGIDGCLPFYTMALLAGQDLRQRAPLPWRQVCAYGRDISSALALLHSRNLLHRDVSPSNVRCVGEQATLIDFGTMVPAGSGHAVVGTAPLLAPEVLYRQPLDARCDIYALGGTLYFALTGHHAYAVRDSRELPTAWSSQPPSLSRGLSDIPEALNTLILSMLAQQVDARPRSAAEVMQRLTTLAQLEPDTQGRAASRAYLTTPSLVGREAELAVIREAIRAATCGASETLFISGGSGVGRSRLINAATVEGHLQGACTLAVRAGAWGRKRDALATALLKQMADDGVKPAPVAREGLAPPALLREMLCHMTATTGPVVVTIDDAHLLDDLSQALLATLTGCARQRLLVIASIADPCTLHPSLVDTLYQAPRLRLQPLSSSDTEALFNSIFDSAPGVQYVAARVHALSDGYPRASLELARHLVRQGQARYGLGGWTLPRELPLDALPSTWEQALDTQLAGLSPVAREFATAVALASEYHLPASHLDQLTTHGDARIRQNAADELVTSGVLQALGERLLLHSEALRTRILTTASPADLSRMHGQLAQALQAAGDDRLLVARHLIRAGEDAQAIDILCAEIQHDTSRWRNAPADYSTLLERALAAARTAGRPAREIFMLLNELVQVGGHHGVDHMRQHYQDIFAQAALDSGLKAYHELPDSLAAPERLSQALALAQERYERLPAEQRVLDPISGIRALGNAIHQAVGFATASMDQELADAIPSPAPFASLAPALRLTSTHVIPAARAINAGRVEEGYALFETIREALHAPDHAGMGDEEWLWAAGALEYGMGQMQAGIGSARALEHAGWLERSAGWSLSAWDVRRSFYWRMGDRQRAEDCRLRMDRAEAASGHMPPLVATSARLQLETAAQASDLEGACRALERLEPHIQRHPGYAPYRHYGPAIVALLRGDPAEALGHAESALRVTQLGRHPTWGWVCNCYLESLLQLGRVEHAATRGRTLLQAAQDHGLQLVAQHVALPHAVAEAHLGHYAQAVHTVDQAISARRALGCRGLNLGWAYEYRARLAIIAGDRSGFYAAARQCAQEYGRGRSGSSLMVRYEALRTAARTAGLLAGSQLPPATGRPLLQQTSLWQDSVDQLLATAPAEQQGTRIAGLLLQESNALCAQLFRLTASGPQVWAETALPHTPETTPPAALLAETLRYLEVDRVEDQEVTRTIARHESLPFRSGWYPVLLGHAPDDPRRHTAVALLYCQEGAPQLPPGLIKAISKRLG